MRRFLTSLVAALGALGCSLPFPSVGPTFPLDGAQVYERSCVSCHGPAGRGDGPVASSLREPPSDLSLLAARNGGPFPQDRVVATVLGRRPVAAHGPNSMPVWSDRFAPSASGGPAVASFYGRRHAELVADHIESLQREPVTGAR